MSGFSGFDIIDPDAIARDIVSGNTVHAAREALRRRHAALSTGRSYLVETTLAGSGILRHMAATRRAGYWMSCISCPSLRPAKRSTVSATASRSAVTMSRKLTRGGGSYGRTPIFRRRLRDRMSSYYMTIPISTSRTDGRFQLTLSEFEIPWVSRPYPFSGVLQESAFGAMGGCPSLGFWGYATHFSL